MGDTKAKPGDTASITMLEDCHTYTMWSFEITNLINAKSLMKMVSGEVGIDDVARDQTDLWIRKDAEAAFLITSTCSPQVKQHLIPCTTSHEMWVKLSQIFEKDSEHQKCNLMQKLYAYEWDQSKDVMENVSNVQNIAYQLNCLDQPINDMAVITKITSILPPKYSHFTSAWDLIPSAVKTLNNLISSLQQEEAKVKPAKSEASETAFNATSRTKHSSNKHKNHQSNRGKPKRGRGSQRGRYKRNGSQPKGCDFCGKTNHATDDCLFKDRWCSFCEETTHYTEKCWHRKPRYKERRYRREDSSPPRSSRGEKEKSCHMASTSKSRPKSKVVKIDNRKRESSAETSSP